MVKEREPESGVENGSKVVQCEVQAENIKAVSEDFQRFTVGVEELNDVRRKGEEESAQDQSQNYGVQINNFKRIQDHFVVLHCNEVRHYRPHETRNAISD